MQVAPQYSGFDLQLREQRTHDSIDLFEQRDGEVNGGELRVTRLLGQALGCGENGLRSGGVLSLHTLS